MPDEEERKANWRTMADKTKRSIEQFVSMLPNLSDLHHPNDINRLGDVVVNALKEDSKFPQEELKSALEDKFNDCNVDPFMASVKEWVDKYLPGIDWAINRGLIK